MLNEILAAHPQAELDGNPVSLTGEVQSLSLATDRSITLDFALILPDEQFFTTHKEIMMMFVNWRSE